MVTTRAALALLLLALPASASASPGALPPVKRTLSAPAAAPRTCHSALRSGSRGVAVTRWTAPMSGVVDVTHDVQRGRAIVRVDNADQARMLSDKGFKYTVLVDNMARSYFQARQADLRYSARTASSALPSGRTEYRVYADYQDEMKGLVASHPGLIRPVTLPKTSWQGRP